MTYPETARAFVRAQSTHPADAARRAHAARALPMSEWGEARRDTMTPATIAANHAVHVADCADRVRAALVDVTEDTTSSGYEIADRLAYAARTLLAAIGEGEDA